MLSPLKRSDSIEIKGRRRDSERREYGNFLLDTSSGIVRNEEEEVRGRSPQQSHRRRLHQKKRSGTRSDLNLLFDSDEDFEDLDISEGEQGISNRNRQSLKLGAFVEDELQLEDVAWSDHATTAIAPFPLPFARKASKPVLTSKADVKESMVGDLVISGLQPPKGKRHTRKVSIQSALEPSSPSPSQNSVMSTRKRSYTGPPGPGDSLLAILSKSYDPLTEVNLRRHEVALASRYHRPVTSLAIALGHCTRSQENILPSESQEGHSRALDQVLTMTTEMEPPVFEPDGSDCDVPGEVSKRKRSQVSLLSATRPNFELPARESSDFLPDFPQHISLQPAPVIDPQKTQQVSLLRDTADSALPAFTEIVVKDEALLTFPTPSELEEDTQGIFPSQQTEDPHDSMTITPCHPANQIRKGYVLDRYLGKTKAKEIDATLLGKEEVEIGAPYLSLSLIRKVSVLTSASHSYESHDTITVKDPISRTPTNGANLGQNSLSFSLALQECHEVGENDVPSPLQVQDEDLNELKVARPIPSKAKVEQVLQPVASPSLTVVQLHHNLWRDVTLSLEDDESLPSGDITSLPHPTRIFYLKVAEGQVLAYFDAEEKSPSKTKQRGRIPWLHQKYDPRKPRTDSFSQRFSAFRLTTAPVSSLKRSGKLFSDVENFAVDVRSLDETGEDLIMFVSESRVKQLLSFLGRLEGIEITVKMIDTSLIMKSKPHLVAERGTKDRGDSNVASKQRKHYHISSASMITSLVRSFKERVIGDNHFQASEKGLGSSPMVSDERLGSPDYAQRGADSKDTAFKTPDITPSSPRKRRQAQDTPCRAMPFRKLDRERSGWAPESRSFVQQTEAEELFGLSRYHSSSSSFSSSSTTLPRCETGPIGIKKGVARELKPPSVRSIECLSTLSSTQVPSFLKFFQTKIHSSSAISKPLDSHDFSLIRQHSRSKPSSAPPYLWKVVSTRKAEPRTRELFGKWSATTTQASLGMV
ncbi:hypothetical protein IE53DRAFT_377683 [Violaceomyces palustris]|uniref:Uncharacterized protein n=1 Tax=Violaceomyces palustris TaxID=1673888 RepID=A0ACD0P4N3_9BASI|nr:hypothetical protein IE53DRAFT_377683 [Violaceomyces palustris]